MIQLLLAVIYLAFISLGLPDSLLGAAWPSIYPELNVPVSYAGAISMTIAAGTIVSSLMSERLTRRFGTGLVTAVSVAMTAAAVLGVSISGTLGGELPCADARSGCGDSSKLRGAVFHRDNRGTRGQRLYDTALFRPKLGQSG